MRRCRPSPTCYGRRRCAGATSSARSAWSTASRAPSGRAACRTPTSSRGRPASASAARRWASRSRSTARRRPGAAAASARRAGASRPAFTRTCRRSRPTGRSSSSSRPRPSSRSRSRARTRPRRASIIVDDADTLNASAANSLLKTLEEPAPRNHLVLCTSAPDRLLPTIRSRSQRVRFRALAEEALLRIAGRARHRARARRGRGRARRRLGGAHARGGARRRRARRRGRRCGPLRAAVVAPGMTPSLDAASALASDKENKEAPAAARRAARAPLPRRARDVGGRARARALRRPRRELAALEPARLLRALGAIVEADAALLANVNPTLALERLLVQLRRRERERRRERRTRRRRERGARPADRAAGRACPPARRGRQAHVDGADVRLRRRASSRCAWATASSSTTKRPPSATVAVAPALRAAAAPLPRVLRVADARDLARARGRPAPRRRGARLRARARQGPQAPIKMFRVELHGGGRATFYFAAEQRIDFRDLVRDLASKVHARVEMRQVGVRDEAKMVGGIGSCGRELCCTTFLPKFAPVSIKMAKNQNLALNPTKVSGQCGRLKCCLVYEDANYVEAAKRLPRAGKRVTTPEGVGRVGDVDVLRERVRVYFEDQPPKVFPAADVSLVPPAAGASAAPHGAARPGGGARPTPTNAPRRRAAREDCRARPAMSTSRFYVTTPIYYVNALPHLGHLLHDRRRRRARALPPRARRTRRSSSRASTSTARRSSASRASKGIDTQAYCDGIAARVRGRVDALRHLQRRLHPHDGAAARAGRRRDVAAPRGRGRHLRGRVRRHVLRRLRGGQDRGRRRHRERREALQDPPRPVERVKEKNYFFRLSKYAHAPARVVRAHAVARPARVAAQRGRVVRRRRPARPVDLAHDRLGELGHPGARRSRARRLRVDRRAHELPHGAGRPRRRRARRGEGRALEGVAPPHRQGHPALPRRLLARHAVERGPGRRRESSATATSR